MKTSVRASQPLPRRALASSSALAIAVAMWALPQASRAQAPGATPQDQTAGANAAPAEVVVTAEHRTESLQKTNIAASSLGPKQLTQKAVVNLATLQDATPSLSVIDQGFSQSINIRGIGLAVVSPQVAPGVATYRDGVFLPTQTSLTQPFYDLDNVQVLRGPQGTFAGDDATGGAIYVNSKSPSLTAGTTGYVTAGYGDYNDVQVQGAINLPISSTLAARIAFNDEQRDSFYRDISPTADGNQPGNLDETDVRIGLLWTPTDALDVLWKTEYDRYANDSFADQPIPGTAFYDLAPKTPFVIDYATPGLRYTDDYVLSSLQINYRFQDGITLKTNSGYQYDGGYTAADQAAAPVPGYLETDAGIERIWTEDISLVSPDSGRLRWVVGGTFFNYTLRPLHAVETAPDEVVDIRVDSPKQSYGVFGSATYSLTPTLDLQVGLRYSQDQVGVGGAVTISSPYFPTFVIPQAAPTYNDNELTGKVALNWNPDARNLVYAFVANGYKAGGANGGGASFQPERVWDYEAGWKSTLLDGHLRTQLGAFYMAYQDFQVSEFDPAAEGSAIANATATSIIAGFEAQGQLQFGPFSADGSLSYVHSNIGALPAQIDVRNLPNGGSGLGPPCSASGVPAGCFDYAPYVQAIPNGPNIYSPEWTADAGAQYAFELGDGDTLTPRVDIAYMSQQWATFFEAPEDNLKARTLVNLQLTYRHADWTVQGYATNLFDRIYVSGFSAQFGNNYFLLPPRQFGVRVTRSF